MALLFNIEIFWHVFLGALIFVRNFEMVKFLHILEEQTQKKIKKFVVPKKIKMVANLRWLPKLGLLVKLEIIFFQKIISWLFY
jgi:hypothetical protein